MHDSLERVRTPQDGDGLERVRTLDVRQSVAMKAPSLLSPMSPTSGHRPSSTYRRKAQTNTVTTSQYITLIPGSEPGVNPNDSQIDLYEYCGITVVDYNETKIVQTELDNTNLQSFLDEERPEWSKVRWINVNGLSWDCISAIAKHWNLHRLAIEDLLNTENRTKCDWYSDHAFIILPMVKLLQDQGATESNYTKRSFLRKFFGRKDESPVDQEVGDIEPSTLDPAERLSQPNTSFRTLQSYYGGNTERVTFMEKNSCLTEKMQKVSVEQVSIFLTADGSVVSFFENSADDIEPPILQRLGSEHTLLRSSCDPSMILQAIVDAIIDLAFPVVHAYRDQMANLEVNIITDPDLQHTTALYIITSELSLLRSTISPIVGLIKSLRYHRRDPSKFTSKGDIYGVEVSEAGKTYLGDVEDHCLMLMDHLDTMKRGADNMIDLIFNTVSSLQNETMKKLMLVTILFLPLTFLTGYFGMNFEEFAGIRTSDLFFWKLAIPFASVTAMWLLKAPIMRWFFVKSTKHEFKKGIRRREEEKASKANAKRYSRGTSRGTSRVTKVD